MAKLEVNCLKTSRAQWPGRRHKTKFAGGGGDAMQDKERN